MEFKAFPAKIETVEDDERTVTGISAVIGVVDAGLDLIHKGAFKKTIAERTNRVRHLWQHDMSLPPTAAITELREVGKGDLPKELKAEFPEASGGLLVTRRYLDTLRADEILAGLKSGAINEMSFGYDAVKFDYEEDDDGLLIRNLKELRLWDTSDVNWGMNEATVAAIKSVIAFQDTDIFEGEWSVPTLEDFTDGEWDELDVAEQKRIAAHYLYAKGLDSFEDLLLPHHKPAKKGIGPVVLEALQYDLGAVPEKDRKLVYEHLAKHSQQFNQEPPTFKELNLGLVVEELLAEDYSDMPEVFAKLQEINELLRAEPPDEALTLMISQEKLLRELAFRERELQLI